MLRFPGRIRFLPILAAALALLAGCSGKSKTTEPTTSGSAADPLVAQANAKLGDALYAEINGPDPQQPSDVDLHEPYDLYQQALAADPNHPGANFGVGVLGLLSLSYDTEVNAAFDEWQSYLQSNTPFQARAGRGRPLGVPLMFATGKTALRLPLDLVPMSAVAPIRAPFGTSDPQIARIQAILRDRALPKLTEAVVRLHKAATPSFQFIVTPHMQGDDAAEAVEIDQTDVLALSAACGLLASMCQVAVAYDMNVAAYDSAGLYTAIQPGSSWLALATGGAALMNGAGVSLSGALTDLDAAITSLKAETDPQDNDVIRRGPSDVTLADLDSLHVNIGHAQHGLTDGFGITADWDNDGLTPDVPLTIRLGQMFQNPVTDWKAEIPAYTATVERRSFQFQEQFASGTTNVSATAPGLIYYYYSYQVSVSDFGPPQIYEYGDAFLATPVKALIDAKLATATALPNFGGNYYASGNTSGFAPAAGAIMAPVNWYESYSLTTSEVFVPAMHFTAATFAAWTWPDPTFHGLLPGMTTSDLFKRTFGMTASGWSRDIVLDWTGSGHGASQARATRALRPAALRSEAKSVRLGSIATERRRR